MKKSILFFLIIFLFQAIFAEKLLLEYAIPLKHTLNPLVTRQYGGVSAFQDKILLTLRNGKFFVFNKKGKLLLKKQFSGEFRFSAFTNKNFVYLINSDKIYKLDKNFKTIWTFTTKSSIIAPPLFLKDQIFLHAYDNSVYLIDDKKGTVLSSKNHYSSEKIRYVKYAKPRFGENDMLISGFSDGTIVEFKKKADNSLLPYYKFKTTKISLVSNSTKFFDVFSVLQTNDALFFSSGESGGVIFWKAGKILPLTIKEMKNLFLVDYDKDKILGYGESGAFLFSKKTGKFLKKVLNSQSVVTNAVKTDKYLITTDFGTSSLSTNSDAGITVLSLPDFKKVTKVIIPDGISGNILVLKNHIYALSNRGVFYVFRIFSSKKTDISLQKIKK